MDKINLNKNVDQWICDEMGGNFSNGIASSTDAAINVMFDQTKQIIETMVEYKDLMMMYTCAIRGIQTKFEVLNSEFKVRYQRNPISSINTRLKRSASITQKLAKKNKICSVENIKEYINDVAGVRVICSYIDDIYKIAESLLRQDDITLISRKDYIEKSKPNGYRSLHLIIKVPVFFADNKEDMKVEVQIRTIAMDFWATLEHQLKYKQEISDQEKIVRQLKKCAETINATDQEMLHIRKQIEDIADIPTDEELLFEKLSKLDIPID